MPFTIGDALEGTRRAGYRYIDLTCSPGLCEHTPLGMNLALTGKSLELNELTRQNAAI